jgi:hypothetical protein
MPLNICESKFLHLSSFTFICWLVSYLRKSQLRNIEGQKEKGKAFHWTGVFDCSGFVDCSSWVRVTKGNLWSHIFNLKDSWSFTTSRSFTIFDPLLMLQNHYRKQMILGGNLEFRDPYGNIKTRLVNCPAVLSDFFLDSLGTREVMAYTGCLLLTCYHTNWHYCTWLMEIGCVSWIHELGPEVSNHWH